MGLRVVGREEELGAVEEVLRAVTQGPTAILIEGEAGIGKTTVWNAGLEAARRAGLRTLVSQGSGAEVKLGYAALTDLLTDVDDDAIAGLPTPQRRALAAAALRAEPAGGAAPDPRAVATGFLTLLTQLADTEPILLAIDELQWLDRSSAEVLRFAVRRLRGPVGLLAARRSPPAPQPEEELRLREAERLRVLRLQPLTRDEIHGLLRERTGRNFPPPTLVRIDRVAAGNPFVALELARTLRTNAKAEDPTLPETLRGLVAARLSGLEPEVLRALLLAAALTRPRVVTIQEALEAGEAGALLGRAEAAEIVTVDGGAVAFIHPLLASGVYAAATAPERRVAHRRLAAVVEGAEERARHLALATVEPEPEVIEALDAAAAQARARGAPADAAELLALAFSLGAEQPERLIAAAESNFAAGDIGEAEALANRAVSALDPGPGRARALGLLGTIRHRNHSYIDAAALLEQACAEADSGASRVMLAFNLVYVLSNCGRLREAPARASSAVAEAEELGDEGLLAEALAVQTIVGSLVGEGIDEAALARALELEDPERPTPIHLTPTFIAGRLWAWVGRFDEGFAALARARRRGLDQGMETELVHMTAFVATITCESGDLDRAWELVEDASERASQLGTEAARAVALANEAAVAGWTGDVERARRCAHESLALFEAIGDVGEALMTVEALGRLELSLGNHEAAAEVLVPGIEAVIEMGSGDPVMPPLAPDGIEALLALDRVEEARPLVRWLAERGEALGRPQVVALAARGRGLLLAAEGDLEAAEETVAEALAAHEHQPVAYEQARSLLVIGQVQRRRRRRRAARESLERAREIFERLGAFLWVRRCESELERLGRRRGTGGDELTGSEQRVAELAARGLTNREVGAELFISPKTVEANLARVYRKLGIHSRAELGRRMMEKRSGADGS
jgi:DNA-binding CsgD family transcriptional regulator